MKIERKWAMPNKWTFTIKPIAELLEEEVDIENELWADPFAGMNSPAQKRNDLNPDMDAQDSMDALEWLKGIETSSLDGVLFDPPYSITQAKEHYDGNGMDKLDTKPTSMAYWSGCKDEIARVLKDGGKAITFGWNSMGICKSRGFKKKRILLVPHGGHKNDTIVTVEIKS